MGKANPLNRQKAIKIILAIAEPMHNDKFLDHLENAGVIEVTDDDDYLDDDLWNKYGFFDVLNALGVTDKEIEEVTGITPNN